MDQISAFLESIKLSRKQIHQNMALFPLIAMNGGEPNYLTLEEALEKETLEITEVNEEGSVPELKLVNNGAQHVLAVEGEELVGAKQNRIVNATFLIARKSELIIPVSCVEQGRWVYRTNKLESGRNIMHASLRRTHKKEVMKSLSHGTGFRSDQGMIWDELAEKAHRMKIHAPTGAMADLFKQQEDCFSNYLKSFHLIDNQVGAIFVLNGKVAGLECFGYKITFSQFFEKLVKSYVLDALDWFQEGQPIRPSSEPVRRFFDATKNAKREIYPSIGLGKSISMQSRSISGSVLIHDDKVLHLSVFKRGDKNTGEAHVPFHRFSVRSKKKR